MKVSADIKVEIPGRGITDSAQYLAMSGKLRWRRVKSVSAGTNAD